MRIAMVYLAFGVGLLFPLGMIGCSNREKLEDVEDYDFVGFFLKTDKNVFFVEDGDSKFFSDRELVKMIPDEFVDPGVETVSFYGFSNGDRIGVDMTVVADLNPRVMDVSRIELLKEGDIANIDESVLASLEELGFRVESD